MSERGSFVTEYIYCDKCFAVVRDVLLDLGKHGWILPVVNPQFLIISGKAANTYSGGEVHYFDFEDDLRERIEAGICHPVRIAVLCDAERYDTILKFAPAPSK